MSLENEFKFLLSAGSDLEEVVFGLDPRIIRQGYLHTGSDSTVRVRIIDDVVGKLTVKGPANLNTRSEYEYEIPVVDAEHILAMCSATISKKRYVKNVDGYDYEIDVYDGYDNLTTVELEYTEEGQLPVEWPSFIGEDVSTNPKYKNHSLALSQSRRQ